MAKQDIEAEIYTYKYEDFHVNTSENNKQNWTFDVAEKEFNRDKALLKKDFDAQLQNLDIQKDPLFSTFFPDQVVYFNDNEFRKRKIFNLQPPPGESTLLNARLESDEKKWQMNMSNILKNYYLLVEEGKQNSINKLRKLAIMGEKIGD